MSTDSLLAKLGTKSPKTPSGAKRNVSDLKGAPPTLRKVTRAMGLRVSVSPEPMSRVHGTETHSMDYELMTPQDIAASIGFIRDPLAREVFCLARWPDYNECGIETRVLVLRRVMDEGQRRADDHITAWLGVELNPGHESRMRMEQTKAKLWPSRLVMYPRIVNFVLRYLDGSGLPEQRVICEALQISTRKFRDRWRVVLEWVHDDLRAMVLNAERQFKGALKSDVERSAA